MYCAVHILESDFLRLLWKIQTSLILKVKRERLLLTVELI